MRTRSAAVHSERIETLLGVQRHGRRRDAQLARDVLLTDAHQHLFQDVSTLTRHGAAWLGYGRGAQETTTLREERVVHCAQPARELAPQQGQTDFDTRG